MSEHLDATIAELTSKRDKLSALITNLEWFKLEFPHTAAATVAIGNGALKKTKRNETSKRRAVA